MSNKVLLSAMLSVVALTGFSGSALAHSSTLTVHTHQNVISAAGVAVIMPSGLMSKLQVTMPPRVLIDPRVTMSPETAGIETVSVPCQLPRQTLKMAGDDIELRQECTNEVLVGPVTRDIPSFWSIMEASGIGRMLSIFGLVR